MFVILRNLQYNFNRAMGKVHQCRFCSAKFSKFDELRAHACTNKTTNHSEIEIGYKCSICGFQCATKPLLNEHTRVTHKKTLPTGQNKFYCDKCDQTFSRLHALRKHRNEKHNGAKLHSYCPRCPELIFATPYAQKEHFRSKHSYKQDNEKSKFVQVISGLGNAYENYELDLLNENIRSFPQLMFRNDILRLLYDFLSQKVIEKVYMKLGVIVTGNFKKEDSEGNLVQRAYVPLRCKMLTLVPEKIPHLNTLLNHALKQCQTRSEELQCESHCIIFCNDFLYAFQC